MQLSGHKNVQSTYNYSHLSQKTMEKYVKNIEWPDFNSSNWNTLLSKQSQTPTAAGLFEDAVLYGRNFNIKSSSSSTEVHKQQTYRGITCIFDSSDDEDTTRVHLWHRKSHLRWKAKYLFLSSFSSFFFRIFLN